jgi:hypothetical protein
MQLDVFNRLAGGPLTSKMLAADLGVRGDKLSLLLHALAAAGLLELDGERFRNGAEAARFLVRGGPSYLGGMHEGLSIMWEAASRSEASIRTGAPQARVDFASMSEEELESFYRGFYGEAVAAGQDLARTRDFTRRSSLIDVGGGSGGLAIALAEACPHLDITVAELPSVAGITRRFVAEAGATERIRIVEVDVTADPPPGSYGVAVLRALVQVLGPDQARRAIRNVAAALEPGGELHIIGRVLEDSRLAPVSSVFSNVVFLNIFEDGQAYTESEHRAWLDEAGFVDVEVEIRADGRGFVRARRPGGTG